MAPHNIQGLNIVHPPPAPSDSHDLLTGPSYPDLSAQLDLWTHLAFDSDESPPPENDNRKHNIDEDDDIKSLSSPSGVSAAIHDGHINVVTGTNLGSNLGTPEQRVSTQPGPFDINSFLAGFSIDPFVNAQFNYPHQMQQPQPSITPSLAQLLALHSAQSASFPPPAPLQRPSQPLTTENLNSYSSSADETYPAAKRSRTRKTSVSATNSPDGYREESPNLALTSPISAAEDKRRRNTAASARFRLKKKEREAALEGKAKELEGRVSERERECEGLKRENGWLKGLVVGVTGAAQGPAATGAKRTRDETE
jgi:hypothetical protein